MATTGQGFLNTREASILNAMLRGSAIAAPSNLYIGAFGAALWQINHAYSSGNFIVSSTSTANTRIFKCTTAGTSVNGAQPAGYDTATDGVTVSDGTAVFTEQTMAMEALADATTSFISELAGNGYARLLVGSGGPPFTQGNFGAAAAIGGVQTGSQSKNANAIALAAASGSNWVPACGIFLADAITAGAYWFYARFAQQAQVNVGQQLQVNVNGATFTVD